MKGSNRTKLRNEPKIKQTLATLPEQRTPTQKDWSALSKQWQKKLDERIAYMQRLRERVDSLMKKFIYHMLIPY